MKMLPLLIAGVLLTGLAFADPETVMDQRAKLTTEEAVAAFDKEKDVTLGEGVMARLVAAETVAKGSEHTERVKLYIEGKLTPLGAGTIQWDKVPRDMWLTAVQHIATKETITRTDYGVLNRLPYVECPELKARQDEILALFPESDWRRYHMKYTKLAPGKNYLADMTPQELIMLTGGIIDATAYDRLRKEMLSRCIGAVTATRRAAGLSNDSGSFDTAMAPILAALNAPLWDGLPAAMKNYGLDLTPPDYTGLIEDLTKRCKDLDERKISDVKGFAGSLMFWKGVEGYKSWSQEYTEN